jgi:hypothetical protein
LDRRAGAVGELLGRKKAKVSRSSACRQGPGQLALERASASTHSRSEPVHQASHQVRIAVHCALTRTGLGRRLLMIRSRECLFSELVSYGTGRRRLDRTADLRQWGERGISADGGTAAWLQCTHGKPVLRQPSQVEDVGDERPNWVRGLSVEVFAAQPATLLPACGLRQAKAGERGGCLQLPSSAKLELWAAPPAISLPSGVAVSLCVYQKTPHKTGYRYFLPTSTLPLRAIGEVQPKRTIPTLNTDSNGCTVFIFHGTFRIGKHQFRVP